jgi:hypothetical protein|tara:strand:- start:512 stop:694 length:183 start_codon:yes stop_codon:yes gene_type:complete
MGRLKEFLIEEQMRLSGDWREQNHYEYLAWRKQLESEQQYEERERVRSVSYRRGNEVENR